MKTKILKLTMLQCLAWLWLIGCIASKDPSPLTDASIDLISRGRFEDASIEVRSNSMQFLVPETSARQLLLSLLPIRTSKAGEVADDFGDFVFSYSPGKSNIVFKVQIMNDTMHYEEGGFIYEGGRPEEFQRLVTSLATVPTGTE